MLKTNGFVFKNGKWDGRYVETVELTENQQWALQTHLKYLDAGRDTLTARGFVEGETKFTRGQPVTWFDGPGNVDVGLVGLSHWQVFKGGGMTHGTREVENLAAVVDRAEGRQ